MNTKLLLLLFLISYQFSFSQFFENDLDYLVFDKQDSLIKKMNVKSLRIIKDGGCMGGALINKTFNEEGNLIYESLNERKQVGFEFKPGYEASTKKLLDDLDRTYKEINYSFDEKGNLIDEKSDVYEYDGDHKINKILVVDRNKVVKPRKKISEKLITSYFDSLKRLKTKIESSRYPCNPSKPNFKRCNNKFKSKETYNYVNDSIVLYNEEVSGGVDVFRKIYKGEFSKITQELDSLGKPNGNKEKMYFNTTTSSLIQETWKKGELKEFKKYTIDKNGLILKQESIQKRFLVLKKNDKEKKTQKGYTVYKYDEEERLVLLESLNYYGEREKRFFNYFSNGLLKKVETQREHSFFSYQEEYTYELKKTN